MRHRLITADAIRTSGGAPTNALVITDGHISAIGSHDELKQTGLAEERFPGSIIVPGLRDSHFHPVTYAGAINGPTLKTAADFAEIGERLRAAADPLQPGKPISAVRLDDEALAEGRLPDRHDLDGMVDDRPVVLHRYCGHIGVANTAALNMAGVGPDTPDPPGGSLDRNESGRPNGILRETGVGVVTKAIAAAAPSRVDPHQFITAMKGLAGLGITSIGAMAGCGEDTWADLGDQVETICETARDLPIRLNVFVIAHSPAELEDAATKLSDAGPMVRFLGLKAFSDGSLGGHTAAMHHGFADQPGQKGTLRLDPAWGRTMVDAALGMGGMAAIHAIGDRANASVLSLFEDVLEAGADPGALRIEHASVLGASEVKRFKEAGVTASVQPAFLASETNWLEKRLGPERVKLTYPFRTLRDAGVPLAGGSDCPVEPPNPWAGIAVSRDRAGMMPVEGLDPDEALALFTDWAAQAMREPEPLAVGSPADFLIVDRDPVESTPDGLRGTSVEATWVNGAIVGVPTDVVTWRD